MAVDRWGMNNVCLKNTMLFRGLDDGEISAVLECLQAEVAQYEKEEMILFAGDHTENLGLVLSGSVLIEQDDIWGNRNILSHAGRGQIFAEAYACADAEAMLVSAIANERCEILFLNVHNILHVCAKSCVFHQRLVENLLAMLAARNLALTRKIIDTTPKSIRGRVLAYLSHQSKLQGSYYIDIPYDRQEFADYLNVDRSALSAELSKMKRDGLIDYEKNHFRLIVR